MSSRGESRVRVPRFLRFLSPVAASVALLVLACPPFDWGWLAWIAPVPLFYLFLRIAAGEPATAGERDAAAPGGRTRSAGAQAWWAGFFWGLLFLLLLVPWFGAFTPAGYPAAAVYLGLLAGIMAWAACALVRRAPGWAPLVLAACWVIFEWLRGQGTLGFPWGYLSGTQYRYLPVLQLLDLTGAFGLSFLMALAAASLAALASPPFRRAGVQWGAGAAVVLALSLARGVWILGAAEPAPRTARVAVVQASESHQAPGAAVVCISRPGEYARRTVEAIRQGAQLVVWPEAASEGDAVYDPLTRAFLTRLLEGSQAHLLAGSFVLHPESGSKTNAAAMLAPSGELLGLYAKVRIVPFGEYLPLRPLLRWTEQYGMPADDLRAGDRWTPLPWAGGRAGVSICFESAFGDISRTLVHQGANLLVVLTSDGWAGRTSAGLQHATFAPLRAVETRRAVARAAATGVSQLIDPYGRPLRSLPMFEKGIAVADLPLRSDLTLYARLGDWPVLLASLVIAAVLLRRRKAASA